MKQLAKSNQFYNKNNELFCFQKKKKYLMRWTEESKNIDHNNLNYRVYKTGRELDFCELSNPIAFLDDIKTHKISIE